MKRACVVAIVLGTLVVLGAIANFNFMLGIEKSAMLISGSVIFAAGLIALAIQTRGGKSTPA